MDFDLSEWGYVLSEDGSTYEYNEENFLQTIQKKEHQEMPDKNDKYKGEIE